MINCNPCSYSCYSNKRCDRQCEKCKELWRTYHQEYKARKRKHTEANATEWFEQAERVSKQFEAQMNLIKAQEEWNKSHG